MISSPSSLYVVPSSKSFYYYAKTPKVPVPLYYYLRSNAVVISKIKLKQNSFILVLYQTWFHVK